MDHFYETIPGWFAAAEIYSAAVRHFGPGARFVEIGAWKGRSTAYMAVEIINAGKLIDFHTVDHFLGSDETAHHNDADVQRGTLKDVFLRNISPVRGGVTVHQVSSLEASMRFEDRSVDFIFIDAGHDKNSVAADIKAWTPKLKPGGVIAGDDINWPGVMEAVSEAFGTKFWPVGRCWVVCPDQASRAAFTGFTGLMIATPCYGGQVTNAYFLSMLRTTMAMQAYGLPVEVVTAPGDSLIARARNSLVAVFMASQHSHFLFIDADIEWEPSSILRLLRADKDVICGAYPKKKLPETYAINFKPGSESSIRGCPISGAVEILEAATGFLLIRRSVFERLIDAHPELHYTGTASLTAEQEHFAYALFDCMLIDGRYMSEDYGFCRRWANLGGEVWLDPNIKLNHHGAYAYEGDVSKLFTCDPALIAAE